MAGNNRENSKVKTPFISFVVCARNDNYGGNFLRRMQVFINSLAEAVDKNRIESELIIVEWNPPEKEKRLKDVLVRPETDFLVIRIIEVPRKVHKRFRNSDKMPIFEYIAKNVGVRRALGEFVIATNPDLLYSENLIKALKNQLKPDYFYRVDRYDIKKLIPANLSLKKQISFAKKHSIKLHAIGASVPINSKLPFFIAQKLAIGKAKKVVAAEKAKGIDLVEFRIHTNVSGDFFLMNRTNWLKLKGYPELPTHSFIDAYICCMAESLGLKQVVFSQRALLFHQEHARPVKDRPMTSYTWLTKECEEMLKKGKPNIKNNNNWGLGNLNLHEFSI